MRRRSSAEFVRRINLFEELGDDGGVGKKEELLVVNDPEEPKCLYKNFTDIFLKNRAELRNVILNKNFVCLDNLRMYGEACYWLSNQPIRRELGVETAEVAGISREQPRN